MASNSEAYVQGVQRAQEREKARQERIKAMFNGLFDSIAKADAPAAKAASERAEARKAKYGDGTWKSQGRFVVVPKGSVPRFGSWDEYFEAVDKAKENADGESAEV